MFGKKRNKIDSKIRFQNPRFKKHLQSARGYKRSSKSIPQTDWGVFMSKIGLDSWKTRVITTSIFFILIYVVYIPNIFFVKNTFIVNANTQNQESILETINNYLNKKIPFPEKNILLLSKEKLSAFVANNNTKVIKVNKVTKKFPSTIYVDITPRIPTFILKNDLSSYIVSNDGILLEQINPNSSSTLPTTPISINISGTDALIAGHRIFSDKTANLIEDLALKLPNITKSDILNFELTTANSSDLTIHFKKDFNVLIDTTLDINQTINRLSLLISQFNDNDLTKLFYIDMRFEGRGYVCYKGTVCIREINLPKNNSTTSLEIIPN